MAEIAIRSFVEASGRVPFQVWLDGLDRRARWRGRVEKWNFCPGYRIYFGHDGELLVILLAGGTKKRQGEDIMTAKARWAEYKARKALHHN